MIRGGYKKWMRVKERALTAELAPALRVAHTYLQREEGIAHRDSGRMPGPQSSMCQYRKYLQISGWALALRGWN